MALKSTLAEPDAILAEPGRLAAIASTGLFGEPGAPVIDSIYDHLTSLASRLLGAPIALISLIVSAEQHLFLGATGIPESARRAHFGYSPCRFVAITGEELVLADVRERKDLRSAIDISDDGLVAYCGVPVRVGSSTVGTFTVIDSVVRQWSAGEIQTVRDFARLAERELAAQVRLRQEALVPSRLAPLLNSLPAGVYATDVQGRLMFYNTRAAGLWGIEPPAGALAPEAVGTDRPSWPDGSPVSEEDLPLRVALRTGTPAPPVEFALGPERDGIIALASAEPLFTADGELAGALGVIQDVTALRKASRLRDELLALVSHELRTPLTVISGMASFLARHGATATVEDRMVAAHQLVAASRRMERVVENMLQLSHLDHDGTDPEPILAQVILNRAMLTHAADFPQSSVTQVGREVRAIARGVENWSVLALTNLLHNATQYGDPSEEPLVELVVHDDEVQFRVCNAGPVFTEAEFEALFEPFSRRPETRDRVPGAGLGLTTARKLAEAQGGRLLAGLRPDGRGPMFTLALPVYAKAEGEAA